MLRCEGDSLYTGITKNLHHRMEAHFYGKKEGAKYTRSRKPKELCMVWVTPQWKDACRLEYFVKSLTKAQKENLLKNPAELQSVFRAKKSESELICTIYGEIEKYPVPLGEFLQLFLSKFE